MGESTDPTGTTGPKDPIVTPEPNYDPLDPNQCGDEVVIADDGDPDRFASRYDDPATNDYTRMYELVLPWGTTLLIPDPSGPQRHPGLDGIETQP